MREPAKDSLSIPGIPEFWDRLRASRHKCLALDYDGTLAPFRKNRMNAFPLKGIRECLEELARRSDTTVAIVSGRPAEEILTLLGDVGVTVVGSHGWEARSPDGIRHAVQPMPGQEQRLRQAEFEVSERGMTERAERKIASLAVHTRGMTRAEASRVEDDLAQLWESDAAEYGLECLRFDGGVELRAAGIDKGTILGDLLRSQPEGAFCVYLGDDETDEDAFREIRDRGFGIRVGPEDHPTQARGRLPNIQAVLKFLQRWIRVTKTDA